MRGLGLGLAMNRAYWLTLIATVALGASGGCKQVDERPAEWGYISPAIFQPNCATPSCHSPAAAVSGLDFSTPDNGYSSLTRLYVLLPDAAIPNSTCITLTGLPGCYDDRPLVTPYDPAGSRLVNMLRARSAPRMPPDRPLPEPDIELVERWILNGACRSPGCPVPVDAAAEAGRDAARDGSSDAAHPSDAARKSDAATDRRVGQ
jgi:hypothetical protein